MHSSGHSKAYHRNYWRSSSRGNTTTQPDGSMHPNTRAYSPIGLQATPELVSIRLSPEEAVFLKFAFGNLTAVSADRALSVQVLAASHVIHTNMHCMLHKTILN